MVKIIPYQKIILPPFLTTMLDASSMSTVTLLMLNVAKFGTMIFASLFVSLTIFKETPLGIVYVVAVEGENVSIFVPTSPSIPMLILV